MAWNDPPFRELFPDNASLGDKGLCTDCGKLLGKFRDILSIRESQISGYCQVCQDKIWTPETEEEGQDW